MSSTESEAGAGVSIIAQTRTWVGARSSRGEAEAAPAVASVALRLMARQADRGLRSVRRIDGGDHRLGGAEIEVPWQGPELLRRGTDERRDADQVEDLEDRRASLSP